MRPEFKKRLITMAIIVFVFCILNTIFKHWIFTSIGFCIGGLICVIRPVKMNDIQPEKRQLMECRIAGIIVVLLGIMLRARLY